MKSLIDLYGVLSSEIESRCCTNAHLHRWSPGLETGRDLRYMQARIEHEGLSFLTISLAAFGKDFERCLDQGRVTDDAFSGFGRRAGLPKYLGWALRLVFNAKTGVLLQEVDIEAVAGIRQLSLMFSKLLVDCSDDRVANAFNNYLEVENDVARHTELYRNLSIDGDFRRSCRVLYGEVLGHNDRDVNGLRLTPKHGPGATAEGISGNRKFRFLTWHQRMDDYFPKEDYVIPSPRFYSNLGDVDIIEPGAEPPVRVISVPKTLKTPRIIAIEPVCVQYAQQALSENLVSHIQADKLVGEMIGFDDQEINRLLAQKGSEDGTLATLDLSEASDRVSIEHVRSLLHCSPDTFGAAMAARSTHARVPSGDGSITVPLTKYASMGSALTFPLEAMVFLAAVFVGIAKARNTSVTHSLVKEMVGRVRVYGDDIIVPVDYVHSVVETLELLGFKVNSSKSFWTGKFRESCGGDYYDGHDVSYVKVRRYLSFQPTEVEDFVSTVSLRNRLYMAGYWSTAAWMDSQFRARKSTLYPTVHPESPAVARHTVLDYETQKMCSRLHAPLVKAYVIHETIRKDKLDGAGALLKYFLKRGDEPYDKEHLERSGRAVSVSIKTRRVRPF